MAPEAQDGGLGALSGMIGGADAAGGSQAAAVEDAGQAAEGAPEGEDTVVEGGDETVATDAGGAEGAKAAEGAGEGEPAAAETPAEESVEAIELPEGVASGKALVEEFLRLKGEVSVLRGRTDEPPAREEPPKPIQPGPMQQMSKDDYVKAIEGDPFGTTARMMHEAMTNTAAGRGMLSRVIDIAKEEIRQEFVLPLARTIAPMLVQEQVTALEASGKYPRFGEFKERVVSEARKSGRNVEDVFKDLVAAEGKPTPGKGAQAVRQAEAIVKTAAAGAKALRSAGAKGPAPAKQGPPSQLDVLRSIIGEDKKGRSVFD